MGRSHPLSSSHEELTQCLHDFCKQAEALQSVFFLLFFLCCLFSTPFSLFHKTLIVFGLESKADVTTGFNISTLH